MCNFIYNLQTCPFLSGSKFQEEFNSDEKAKLYKAIGYDENAKDPTFPIEVSISSVIYSPKNIL